MTGLLPFAAARFLVGGLALSVTFGDSSPRGRAFCLSLWERWRGDSRDGEGKPLSHF